MLGAKVTPASSLGQRDDGVREAQRLVQEVHGSEVGREAEGPGDLPQVRRVIRGEYKDTQP